jgi:hypothetical protein
MANWFKIGQVQAFDPISLEDRNILNEKIRYFEDVALKLEKLSKVVFQDSYFAKNASFKMANDKAMSSYPSIRDLLLEADQIALDSPWKFAGICSIAAEEAGKRIKQLKKQRKDLIEDKMPNRMKGWVDKHKKNKKDE